jgi:hypothetical protein
MVQVGKKPDPSGEVYKTTTRWGQAGSPKMVPVWQAVEGEKDLYEVELQLNRYRIMLLALGVKVTNMRVMVTVRDGSTSSARSRGITQNMYLIPIKVMQDDSVAQYFENKKVQLLSALAEYKLDKGFMPTVCTSLETWQGKRCVGYCDVAMYCPQGANLISGGKFEED